jgi:iron complex outermembrane recepter protein
MNKACAAALGLGLLMLSLGAAVAQQANMPQKEATDSTASTPVSLNIKSQPLESALQSFAAQTGLQVIFPAELTKSMIAPAIVGKYAPEAALIKLLANTGLRYSFVNARTIAVSTTPPTTGEGRKTTSALPEGAKAASGSTDLAQSSSGNPAAQGRTAGSSQDNQNVPNNASFSDSDEHSYIPEILVRGARSANLDLKRSEDDVQPYYIFNSEQIEQSGATSLEGFLQQQLTMDTSSRTNSQQIGTNGTTSAINLRGLGSNETLVLIDGRRSAGTSIYGSNNQPDITGIPISAVDRIEVLPSGASAIYGGAAVGGVINIILKKQFNGGDVKLSYDNTTSGSAPLKSVSATYGLSLEGGKTQIMVAGRYSDGESLQEGDRLNLIQRGIENILTNSPTFLYSPFNPFPGATPNIASADGSNLVLRNGTLLNSPITSIPKGAGPSTDLTTGLLANAGTYNLALTPGTGAYGLQDSIGTVPTQKSVLATIRREMTSMLDLFVDLSTSSTPAAPVFNPIGGNGAYTVPAGAPSNPFQQDVLITFPTNVPTTFYTNSVTHSATVGLVARLPSDWRSELDYTWSKNTFHFADSVSDDTSLGNAIASGAINPFVDTVANPLQLSSYLAPDSYSASSTLNDVNWRASGPIGYLPGGRPTLTIGLEHRKEGTDNGTETTIFPLNPTSDETTTYFGQSQSTNSIYAEAELPVLSGKNAVPLVHSLDVQVAGRSERYTVDASTVDYYNFPNDPAQTAAFNAFGINPTQGLSSTVRYTSTNPTVGLKYDPVRDLALRVSYARAFLPPTAGQLLRDPTNVCATLGGPCQPITDPVNGQTYNVNYTSGGNPSLKPQTSTDWDFGIIFEPQVAALKGLRVDLEYYRIIQPNYITIPDAQSVASNPAYASRVTRDPSTGLITTLDLSYVNAEKYRTNGWDLTADYTKPTNWGTFDFHLAGTLVASDQRQYTIGGAFLQYASYVGDGGEVKTKANATARWSYKGWSLGWTTTYFGSYYQPGAPGSPTAVIVGAPFTRFTDAQGSNSIPSQTYHQIFGSYGWGKNAPVGALSDFTLQFGVKNVFNTLPPFDVLGRPYFYSGYGDPRLRDYWISIRKGFN